MDKSYSIKELPKVFISYCHKDEHIVNKVDTSFDSYGITLTRDIRDAENYTSLKNFMKKIKSSEYVILVISDSYMKSYNCMFEIVELLKNDDYKDHIFPIIIKSGEFDIYSKDALIKYISFWSGEYNQLDKTSKHFRGEEKVEVDERLRNISNIKQSIGMFIETLNDLKAPSLEKLIETDYEAIKKLILPDSKYFNKNLFERCKKQLDKKDIASADEKYNNSSISELGDWLLDEVHDYDLLVDIIKEIGVSTPKTEEIKDRIRKHYESALKESDSEYNDMLEQKKYNLKRILDKLNDAVN